MNSLKLYVLTCFIICFIPTAWADNNYDTFIEESQVDGKIQTIFFDEKNTTNTTDPSLPADRTGAWVGTIWVNAQTGYLNDFANFGVSAYRAAKLYMDSTNRSDGQVMGASSNLLTNSNDGFGKLGQLWIDFKFPQFHDDGSGDIKIGRQLIKTGLLTVSGSRSMPSSWQGIDITTKFDSFEGKVAWVNQVSKRNQSGFHNIENMNGDQINWITSMQLNYTFVLADQRSIEIQYRNGVAYNYVNSHNGNIWFKLPLHNGSELTLGGMLFYARESGNLWSSSDEPNIAFKEKAKAQNINAEVNHQSWKFNVSLNFTKADTEQNATNNGYRTLGYYNYYFGDNTQGVWDVPTHAVISDFNFNHEKTWLFATEYDFDKIGVEGLSLGYAFIHGSRMKVTNPTTNSDFNVSEYEHDFTLKYNFSRWQLKDLQFKLQYSYYKNDEAFRRASGQEEEKSIRAWLSYDLVL